jgi:hypothetical protein
MFTLFTFRLFSLRLKATGLDHPRWGSQIWSNQGIKLLLILFKKNDIESIIPTSLAPCGSFHRDAPISKERVP